MVKGAKLMGLLGGLSGLYLGYLALRGIGLGVYLHSWPEATIRGLGIVVLGAMAIVGAFIRPSVSVWLWALAIVVGVQFAAYFWTVPGVLLLLAEVLLALQWRLRSRVGR